MLTVNIIQHILDPHLHIMASSNKPDNDIESPKVKANDSGTAPQEEREGPVTPAEGEPFKSLSYIVFTVQFFFVTLDLFVETADISAWHYSINSVEFVTSLYLASYQLFRTYHVYRKKILASICSGPIFLILCAGAMQLFVVGLTGYWFNIDNDRETNYLEWAIFGNSLVWGVVNPVTFAYLRNAAAARSKILELGTNSAGTKTATSGGNMTPAQAIASVFGWHFSRTPLLFGMATLFASGNAILTAYQGAVINELTKVVTGLTPGERDPAIEREISNLSGTLAGIWFCANLCRFLFDLASASLFSKLEVWLKRTIFLKAFVTKDSEQSERQHQGIDGSNDRAAEYLARYTSDVNGVMALYSTLLRGVIMNVLLIITSFVFLAIEEYKVATVTLGFLAMGVTTGPTDLAGDATAEAQVIATKGMSFFGDELRASSDHCSDEARKEHEDDILAPLQRSLWKQNFYANSVDTYIQFFSSFLTVIVIITMTWEVYFGDLKSSDFLGIFFVYKQLQKPCMKISGVIKSAVRRSANVKRINEVIFGAEKRKRDQLA